MERLHAGWLTKSPPEYKTHGPWKFFKSKWRRRYFVLYVPPSSGTLPGKMCSAILDYYSDDKMTNKKGSIDLEKCHTIFVNFNSETYKHIFVMKTVCKDKERDYYLSSESQEQLDEWVKLLCDVVGLNRKASPKPLSPLKSPEAPALVPRKQSLQTPLNTYTTSPVRTKLPSDYLFLEDCSSASKQPADEAASPAPALLPKKTRETFSSHTSSPSTYSIYNTPTTPSSHSQSIYNTPSSSSTKSVYNTSATSNSRTNVASTYSGSCIERKELSTNHTSPDFQQTDNDTQDGIYNTPRKTIAADDVYKLPKSYQNQIANDEDEDDSQFEPIWIAKNNLDPFPKKRSNASSGSSKLYMNEDLLHACPPAHNSIYDVPSTLTKPSLPPKSPAHYKNHLQHHNGRQHKQPQSHHQQQQQRQDKYVNSLKMAVQTGRSHNKNVIVCHTDTTIAFNKDQDEAISLTSKASTATNNNNNKHFRSPDLLLPVKVGNKYHSENIKSSSSKSATSSSSSSSSSSIDVGHDDDDDDDEEEEEDGGWRDGREDSAIGSTSGITNGPSDLLKFDRWERQRKTRMSSDCNVFVNDDVIDGRVTTAENKTTTTDSTKPNTAIHYADLDFEGDSNVESRPPKLLLDNKIEYKEIDFEKTDALKVTRENLHSQ
ncbi:hypothetical protein HELRODRAFT_191091 [Helobdella robusta]|uniref:PH domain-containing protein n=1 Tax=Helobdella robusta TaxID=6412 RepID=T1FSL0_HELRO|nr:hypothetical protein HELRODRAFT_191091 [Helobdella robusta]ESO07206.1 hypothetical protein HELRODRAFT_191091 [Helobdella robusta]